ncbi:hypothetical protein [Pseudomonas argentinensis]|uniref:hypothetical protein n=1 Tax=Phytopseudomonas argentinensis TaxID=289370 RepID=UPI001113E3FE|nr:hypothetical protein [Pseudomonas argentinensis]
MIIEKLSEKFSRTLDSIEQEESFLDLIKALTEFHRDFNKYLLKVLSKSGNPNEVNSTASSVQSQITSEVSSAVRAARTSTIVVSANRIKNLTENIESKPFQTATIAAENFIDAFDSYIHTKDISNCIDLVIAGRDLNLALHQIRLVKNVIEPSQGNQSNPSIRIYIPGETDLEDFSTKLLSLTRIIETCCNMLDMSMTEAGVTIEKIESGSFFAKISANPLVVAIATIIISQGSEYFFSQIRQPNEAIEIRENSDTLASLLKIREVLNANGIPTAEMDETIKSAALSMAKQLNKLVGHSQSIEINDEIFKTPESRLITSSTPTEQPN